MRRLAPVVVCSVMLAVLVPLSAALAEAQSAPPWQSADWTFGGTAVATTIAGPETLHVTDFECVGDQYVVVVDGSVVGQTSNTPTPGDDCDGGTPDEACALGTFSSGSFALPAGDNLVEIRHLSGFGNGSVAFRTGPVGCNNVAPDPAGGGPVRGLTALCIEDDFVQANATGMRTGTQIIGPNDDVLITTGPPTCQFNCIDGFDINCDGKIGDYCPVELDRELVDNVYPCLDAANPSTPAIASGAEAAPTPAPIAGGGSTLAHTGSVTGLVGMAGMTMLSCGAVAVITARRMRGRRDAVVDHRIED